MAEEIAVENGRISNFEQLVSRDLDLGSGHTAHCLGFIHGLMESALLTSY